MLRSKKNSKIYLRLEHIAQKEHHHAGIDFVFRAPRIPARHRLPEHIPNVIRRHNDEDQCHFGEENGLVQEVIEAGRVIVGTIDYHIRIAAIQNGGVFLERLSVAARIAGKIQWEHCK